MRINLKEPDVCKATGIPEKDMRKLIKSIFVSTSEIYKQRAKEAEEALVGDPTATSEAHKTGMIKYPAPRTKVVASIYRKIKDKDPVMLAFIIEQLLDRIATVEKREHIIKMLELSMKQGAEVAREIKEEMGKFLSETDGMMPTNQKKRRNSK